MDKEQAILITVPLVIFLTSELILIENLFDTILFYMFSIVIFIVLTVRSKKDLFKKYWGALVIPVILRIINLSMPFPILNAKLQLTLTYAILIYCTFLFSKFFGVTSGFFKMPDKKFSPWIIAVLVGLALGITEHFILGTTPMIQLYLPTDRIFLFFVIFTIGFGEEFVYRGVLQTTHAKFLGQHDSLLLNSILFGLMHLIWRSPIEFVFTTTAGFVFGLQYNNTGSLWPPTLSHIINNTIWLLAF